MIVKFQTNLGWDYRQCDGVATKECLKDEVTQEASLDYSLENKPETLAFLRSGPEVFEIIRYSVAYLLNDKGETINKI